ncbi:PspC domain-containing protein [Nesterenkonia muleiensis]|uniref:PspC domain-containing protein n=1 Tax=Nesterenkonia muleiensis TaxID=2282648 RepID=UPI000E759DED|nr:PspC domain-containing protein [Nesterenkonia muleiensis]
MSTSQHGRAEAGHQIFNWVRTLGVHRPDGAWAGGVFAATAQKLAWDTALVRGIGVVAFIIFFSPMALFYGLSWLFLPDARGRIHAQEALRGSYPGGFWGAGIMTFVGAVNVFTPNIVGPFAILLNLAIIGLVTWLLWAIFRGYQRNTDGGASEDSSPKAHPSAHQPPESQDRASAEENRREDGKPAWYPKAGPEPAEPKPSSASASSSYTSSARYSTADDPFAGGLKDSPASQRTHPEEDPREREEKRRRRMVSYGLLLLAIPLIAAAMWFATSIGLATTNAVLLGLAAVVTLLALMHLWSAVRGTKGRAGLLSTFTALMMVVFLFAPASLQDSSNYVFGNYTTQSDAVNSAFSNTRVDLRDIRAQVAAEDGTDLEDLDAFQHEVEVNAAFGNTEIIVPDDIRVEINNGQALGNLNIRTEGLHDSSSGISGSDFVLGDSDSSEQLVITLNAAFGNITVYDETTYNQEESGIVEDAESSTTGYPTPGAPSGFDAVERDNTVKENR